MAFGFNSYSKPTPNRINILFDCIGAMLNIIAGFFIGAGFINHNVSDVVAGTINLLLAPMVPVIKRLFSVDVEPGQKTVPIADVKVMEEK